jgi:hypothetical protein
VTFRLDYSPPPAPPAPVADRADAVYALADAGASAAVELDGYRLPVDGTGLAELHRQAARLLDVLRGGDPAPGDDDLRAELPDVPAGARLHSWLFASYMLELPVLVFALAGPVTRVFTRTRAEREGWPLVVLDGRDRPEPAEVPTAELTAELERFLERIDRDAAAPAG